MRKIIIMVLVALMLVAIVQSQGADISVDIAQDCKTVTWTEKEPVYENVTRYNLLFDFCDGFSEENQSSYKYMCNKRAEEFQHEEMTGTRLVEKTKQVCEEKQYTVSVDDVRYGLDFEEWGACKYEEVGDCVVVTCVSRLDGAHNGRFTDCNFGKSCEKFEICKGGVKVYYKNSRDDWVENDPTFKVDKLQLEVLQ